MARICVKIAVIFLALLKICQAGPAEADLSASQNAKPSPRPSPLPPSMHPPLVTSMTASQSPVTSVPEAESTGAASQFGNGAIGNLLSRLCSIGSLNAGQERGAPLLRMFIGRRLLQTGTSYGGPTPPTAATPASTPSSTPSAGKYYSYTVKAGDTLSTIAGAWGTTAVAILDANPVITDINSIQVGQQLLIPATSTGTPILTVAATPASTPSPTRFSSNPPPSATPAATPTRTPSPSPPPPAQRPPPPTPASPPPPAPTPASDTTAGRMSSELSSPPSQVQAPGPSAAATARKPMVAPAPAPAPAPGLGQGPVTTHQEEVSAVAAKVANGTLKCDNVGSQIAGGSAASIARYPYAVSLRRNVSGTAVAEHFCGGVLIGPDLVLTAAHCCEDKVRGAFPSFVSAQASSSTGSIPTNSTAYAYIGADCISGVGTDAQIVQNAYTPSTWTGNYAQGNDICILKTARRFRNDSSSSQAGKIFAKLSNSQSDWSDNFTYRAIGWGMMSTLEPISPHLKAAQLGYFPLGVCQNLDITANRAQTKIAPQQICTFAKGGNSTCQGDSGGPLIKIGDGEDPTKDVVVGIVSFGSDPEHACSGEGFSVYTSVQSYNNDTLGDQIQNVQCNTRSASATNTPDLLGTTTPFVDCVRYDKMSLTVSVAG